MRIATYKDTVVFHPAYYLDEILCEMDMSEVEFANHMNMKIAQTHNLLDGEMSVTADLAKKLEELSGVSAEMWETMQKKFDRQVRRMSAAEKVRKTKAVKSQKGLGLTP